MTLLSIDGGITHGMHTLYILITFLLAQLKTQYKKPVITLLKDITGFMKFLIFISI